uniref:Ankyrin repeat domain-containing protein n=1 Tax=Mantoniella antarctica TaxID=81844 RepID=A0A7S0SLN4_9CHLO
MTWSEESKNTAELEAQFAGAGLFMAAQNGEIENVRKQIEAGVDPNSKMNDGLTPLFMAVANKRIDMANLLLDKGADVDCTLNDSHATPLCLAAQHGDMPFVKLLLDRGADPRVVMKGGIGAFFLAVQGPSLEVAALFLEKGADVNCQMESTGATPLIVAALKNKLEAVELLLSRGADAGVHLRDGVMLFKCAEELMIQDTLATKMAEASSDGTIQTGHKWTAAAVAQLMGFTKVADKINAATVAKK